MASSMILTQLPRDATSALAAAGTFPQAKVQIHFKPINAPPLKTTIVKVAASQRFESVVAWVRKRLGSGEKDHVFLYVNSTFAPALDEVVGNLHRVSCVVGER
ncbi:ubiquitin-like autophagy protein Apg12-domain-containing protein [Halenospora varia]|nr:ubiquitin-like autophagy protein Apg12-domain-containing protein [Halenospora varia]